MKNTTSANSYYTKILRANARPAIVAILTVAILSLVVFGISRRANPMSSEGLRLAAILNLSGPASRFDAVKQQTLKIAEARVRALYPDSNIAIKVFDAGGGPEATASSVGQARSWGAMCYATGTSPTALAVAAAIRKMLPEPLHMANAANPDFGPPRPNEYRFWPDWDQEAAILQKTLREQGLNHLLVIHSTDPYSQALLKALKGKLEQVNQRVVLEQQYDPAGTPDFRPILIRAKEQRADALVVLGLPPGINAIANQLAEVKWDVAVFGGVNITLSVATFKQLNLNCPLWVIETDAMAESLPAESEAAIFRETYRKEFGEVPPFHALYLADVVYLLAAAEKAAEKADSSISQQIAGGLQFSCASGTLTLTKSGILTIPMHPRRVR